MKKCEFCSKEISYYDMYCCDKCQNKANKFYDTREKYGKVFGFFDAVFVFMIPIGIFLGTIVGTLGDVLIVAGLVGLGIMLIFLPFPTESMIKKHQIRNSKKMCRIFALVLIAVGIIGAVVMFLL